MQGYISKFESLGTVDGPGVRAVVFTSGCPLRCVYCHNPETQDPVGGRLTDKDELVARIRRLYPYIKDGGVTFSGGEPLLSAKFLCEVARELKADGIHLALDTSGAVINEDALALLDLCDLVLLDVKFVTDSAYKLYTGGSLCRTLEFLALCEERKKPVHIRQVTVPGINDNERDIIALRELLLPYTCVKKIELLPFRKLCLPKYEALGIPFPLSDTPEMDTERLSELSLLLNMD